MLGPPVAAARTPFLPSGSVSRLIGLLPPCPLCCLHAPLPFFPAPPVAALWPPVVEFCAVAWVRHPRDDLSPPLRGGVILLATGVPFDSCWTPLGLCLSRPMCSIVALQLMYFAVFAFHLLMYGVHLLDKSVTPGENLGRALRTLLTPGCVRDVSCRAL